MEKGREKQNEKERLGNKNFRWSDGSYYVVGQYCRRAVLFNLICFKSGSMSRFFYVPEKAQECSCAM
jgi:hypothetical protein